MNIAQFLLSIPLLIRLYADRYYQDDLNQTMMDWASEFNVPAVKVYDFVIVGGGTAGCVLAKRLSSEAPFSKVLLLEAGGTPPPAAVVPFFAQSVALDPEINYFFHSVPMTNASQKNDGVVINHTGKMLGGSGTHNELLHSRGSPKDFDNWAQITNDNSWTYANVLQYFKKSENFIGKQYGSDNLTDYYGKDGPITVDTIDTPVLPLWFQAGQELGYPQGDPNGFQKEGFTSVNRAVNNGRRSTSFSEYVEKWENDPANNGYLTIMRYANVSEILVDNNKQAYGVAFTRHGFPQIVHATKEVIISAGGYSSPLLLMKSGIGPTAQLRAANIPVKVPIESVGRNISEHASLILGPFLVNDTSLFTKLRSEEIESLFEDYHKGQGILTGVEEGPMQCFIRSSKAEPDWPDIWVTMHPYVMTDDEPQIINFYIILGRPKSRGELTLNTTAYNIGIRDDVQLSLIDFKLLTHPDDVDTLLEAIKFTLRIAENTTALKRIGMTYAGLPDPACSAYVFRSDDYWKCHLYQNTNSWNHMTGSCSMGPDSGTPDQSVIDPQFRVRGVSNLRVIDISTMPAVVNTNTNAAVLMIAEKAADDIRNTWFP